MADYVILAPERFVSGGMEIEDGGIHRLPLGDLVFPESPTK